MSYDVGSLGFALVSESDTDLDLKSDPKIFSRVRRDPQCTTLFF
jgi:hypothetical protein